MATVRQIDEAISARAPKALSADWDNDGIMCCADLDREVRRALFVLDINRQALEYAVAGGFDAILSHHPLIFRPLKAVLPGIIPALLANGISAMSYHTRLDAAPGGVNDALAEMLGLEDCAVFAEGCGRIGTLRDACAQAEFAALLRRKTGCAALKLGSGGREVHRVAVVSGSGGDYIGEAAALGADTFCSGEIGYHRMADAADAGMNAFEIGHDASENHAPRLLEAWVKDAFPDTVCAVFCANRIRCL